MTSSIGLYGAHRLRAAPRDWLAAVERTPHAAASSRSHFHRGTSVAALNFSHASLPPAQWGSVVTGRFSSTVDRARQHRRRGIILDLDDTLYPRERYIRSGFAAVAKYLERRWGVPAGGAFSALSKAFSGAQAGQEFQAMCDKYELPREEVTSMLGVFRAHKPNLWLPYETGQALRRLRADGWRLVDPDQRPSLGAGREDRRAGPGADGRPRDLRGSRHEEGQARARGVSCGARSSRT